MGLDVLVLCPPGELRPKPSDRIVLTLECDGGYCYLERFLPASSSTGVRIQTAIIAGDTYFEGANLEQLRGCLQRARAALETQPARWKEYVGFQDRDGQRVKLYETVEREHLRLRVETLLAAVSAAEQCGGRVYFWGD
jgi:hypothetical protein